MNQPLNILLIEDSEDDAVLLKRHLTRAGYAVEMKRVDQEQAIRSHMQQGGWDLVISDFNMPDFTGLDALAWVRESDQDLPFILVSGTVGEETAVLAMKSGANDYIMKDNSQRLVPAIERELREAENRRARREVENMLRYHATHDALTGLYNRREFETRLDEFLLDARENGSQHVMLYMDLDQFKIINDTLGHLAGDALLQQLCEAMNILVRTSGDVLARLGGDEFGVILPRCPEQQGLQIAENLRAAVQNFLFEWQGQMFGVGISIGMVIITQQSESTTQILSAADKACYVAKESGRNRVHLYQANDSKLARHSSQMQWALRIPDALRQNRFVLHSQIIVPASDTSQAVGHEFLVRMVDESQQLILPEMFIAAAERYDLMPSIDRWVVKAALAWLQQQEIPADDPGFFCINLSGRSLTDPGFLEFLLKQIESTGVAPQRLCFEITETAAIRSLLSATKLIDTLHSLNCRFALDDFGSGLCSFNYLKDLPVDYVKIDGSFIANITTDKVSRAIVESINSIAQTLGMKTVAEFVENAAILNLLRDMGVDYVQGYHISLPQPLA